MYDTLREVAAMASEARWGDKDSMWTGEREME
jgi:hypothetical protein